METEISNEVREFVAGFVDGDGTISISKPKAGRRFSFPPKVQIYQSRNEGPPPELEFVKRFYGGTISVARDATESVRKSWVLSINRGVEKILADVAELATIKRRQARLALDYMKETERWRVAENYRERLKNDRRQTQIPVLTNRITPAYIAGLFAADGTIAAFKESRSGNAVIQASIKSKKTNVLGGIQVVMGGGRVYPKCGEIHFGAKETVELYETIRPHLIGAKAPQFDIAMKIQRSKHASKRRTASEVEESDKNIEEIKRLKRQ